MMKKVFLYLLIFIFFIIGCTNKTDNKIHLTYSTWGSKSEIDTVKELIAVYEQDNPDIKIDLIHIPDNYFQKIHLLIASNLAPDIIFVNNLNAKLYIDANKFEPLNKYLGNSENISKKDFIENSFAPFTYYNKIYGIPRDISNLVIYYHKVIFDKYNVPYPDDNWTMDEFLKTAQKLTKDINNDKKIDILGVGFEKNSLFWLPFLWSNGGGILNDKGEIIIDNENSKCALQFYSDLRNKYHVAPKVDEQASLTTSQLFMQGKIAMHLCGRWCSLTYKKDKNLSWDVAKFPQGKNGSVVGLDVSGWAISSSSKHKREAWKFIEFLASEKSMEKFTESGLIIPSNKKVANSLIFLTPPPSNAKVFIEAINNAKATPVCEKYSEINDILNEKFEEFFNGKLNIDDIINKEMILKLNNLTDRGKD
ncbi:MAG: sugar ABC transporter substrate-binding protein [Candidatus Gastranaerophilales bacterium]|nr:sugar ABC transporter substrate-binding protein [Candidatus Gastranaerophilales bacterium]